MAKRTILQGATNQTIDVFILDSSSTTGAGLTGLVYDTAGLTCYYREGATATPTQLSLATQTVGGAHSDGGFVAVDATNMPGAYRLDLSDTIISGANPYVSMYLQGATNMAPTLIELELVAYNPFAALATPTNITAATGIVLSGVTHTSAVIPTVTTLTNAINAASVVASVSGSVGSVTGGVTLASTQGSYAPAKATDNVGIDWSNVSGATTANALTGTTIANVTLASTQGSYAPAKATDNVGVDWSNVSAATTANVLSGTTVATVTTLTGHTAQTGDSFAIGSGTNGFAAIKVDTGAILIDTNELQGDWTNGGRLDLLLDAIPTTAMRGTDNAATAASLATAQTDLDTITGTDGVTLATAQALYAPNVVVPDAAGVAPTVAEILTTAMTESYAADGVAPTLAQAVFAIQQFLQERSTATTTVTVKKLDGSTSAMTFTLDDATTPTSITRAT